MNINNQAITLINKIEIGVEFLKCDIYAQIGCRDRSLTYCFSELVKRGYLTVRKLGKKFIYRRVTEITEFITMRNKNKPQYAAINAVKDAAYYFAFGGNPEIVRDNLHY